MIVYRQSTGLRWLTTLIALTLTLAFSLAQPRTASAHATLAQTDPIRGTSVAQSPETITLWFSEAIEPRYSRIEIVDADGSRIRTSTPEQPSDIADPALRLEIDEELERGSYTVVWSTLSAADGHAADGFFSFVVGDAPLPTAEGEAVLARDVAVGGVVPQFVDAGVRWASLLGQAIIVGLLLFLAVVLMPLSRRTGVDVPLAAFRRIAIAGFIVLVLGQVASAIVQVIEATRSATLDVLGQPLLTVLTETRSGWLWLARSVLLIALGLVVWMLVRRDRLLAMSGNGRLSWWAALGVSATVLLTTSLGSQAAARSGSISLPVFNDWLHLVATSVWVGGLVALIPGVGIASAAGIRRPTLSRFSALAAGAVIVLTVTGLLSTRLEVVSWDGLVSTDYGSWLILKLAIVVAALGLSAWHLMNVRPSLDDSRPEFATKAERQFRRDLRLEVALAFAVLAVTSLLTSSIPARDLLDTGDSFGATEILLDASITLRATPGQVGTNEFVVSITEAQAGSFGTVQRVSLRFTPVDARERSGSQQIQLREAGPIDPFTYRGTGAWLAFEGQWAVTVVIRRAGVAEDLESTFDLTADGDDLRLTGVETVSSSATTPAVIGLGAAWIVAGIALVIGGLTFRRRARLTLAYGLLTLSLLAFAIGSLLVVVSGIVTS